MGKLTCLRCRAQAEAETREEADAKIDHALGRIIGRPCSGKESELQWDGATSVPKRETVVVEEVTEKPKKKPKRR